MKLKAKWIWRKQNEYNKYNQTVIAQKKFRLGEVRKAIIRITADSYYRLYINDKWVADGPCRSWPEHFQYDQIEVAAFLKSGDNEIKIVANYYGAGVLTRLPKQAGILVQLDVKLANGSNRTIISDDSWQIAETKAWISNTPKISFNLGPYEYYDARVETKIRFSKANVLYDAKSGPWKNLHSRDVALLTKKPLTFKSYIGANIVTAYGLHFCLSAARLTHPGLIEANSKTSTFCGMATVILLKEKTTLLLHSEGFGTKSGTGQKIAIDGKRSATGRYTLSPGKHLLLVFSDGSPNPHGKEKIFRIVKPSPEKFKLQNPLNPRYENPWCFISFDEYMYAKTDIEFFMNPLKDPEIKQAYNDYNIHIDRLMKTVSDIEIFKAKLGKRAKLLPSDEMFVKDPHWQFPCRKIVGNGEHLVKKPAALLYDNSEYTVVMPAKNGNVELCYDLGEESCGYYSIELLADEGVAVDVAGIEFISPEGELQHTGYYRNSMRYITKNGLNRFVSLVRRAGRYIYITFRNQKSPVQIRHIKLIESTYPVNYCGSFSCSDNRLDKIWDISVRTLKLCMEDTFTDCPLYEQTCWVGDARNEALFAYSVFGATDISRRCLKLVAQSLERYPIVGCQVPSSWDCLLPAWSFLWGIAVWDYYWYSGDINFVKEIWPSVIKNIKGSEALIDEHGLFSGPFWNMFDWSGADQNCKTVVHNSMFLIGAVDAALKCGKVINENSHTKWLNDLRKKLCRSINSKWDTVKKAYIDSIHDDGTLSNSTCQHTSFLSILYDIIEHRNISYAIRNIFNPPAGMVRLGSPFAMLYLYETLEKLGYEDEIIKSIYSNYMPMLAADSTTVWELLADSPKGQRSRCHAWSSAPAYFLNRIILGIKQTSPGGSSFDISPRLNGLKWASGTVATPLGAVKVRWQLEGRLLNVKIKAAKGIEVNFRRNQTHSGLKIKTEISAG